MNKKHKQTIVIALVVLVVGFIVGMIINLATNYVYHSEEHRLVSTTDEKTIAPDFTVFDMENNEVHLSEHIGKKTIVSFWATWCGPCKVMLGNFNELYEENPENVEFMMINLTDGIDETVEVAKKYIEGKGFTVPVYYDLSYSAAHEYHINSLPTTVFIDENGYISDIHQGYLDKGQIEDCISAIGTTGETLQ